jgi:DNA modification methylase
LSNYTIINADVLDGLSKLDDCSVQTCVTSPPYWGLRDYGVDGQLGLERTPEEYVARMVAVFREVRRVLNDDGTLWLNLGDSYAAQRGGTTPPAETLAGGVSGWAKDGSRVNRDRYDGYNPSRNAGAIGLKHKDLVGIPWRVAFALQADGWYLRQDIIWHKPNPMP